MDVNKIATKDDVEESTKIIIEYIKQCLKDAGTIPAKKVTNKFLRSRDIKTILAISDNKLKDMRLKGEIPFVKKGDTFFYPEDEFNKSFNVEVHQPVSNTGVRK